MVYRLHDVSEIHTGLEQEHRVHFFGDFDVSVLNFYRLTATAKQICLAVAVRR